MMTAITTRKGLRLPVTGLAVGELIVAAALALGAVGPAGAQPVPPATPAAVTPGTPTAATPAQLLQQFPNGGPELISRLRELAINPANLAALLAVLPNANTDQKMALGSALGQATRIAARTDLAYARMIQQDVVGTRDPDLIVAYAAVVGDQPIGAGGGGGGGGGGVGGQTNALTLGGFGGGLEGIGGGGVPTGPFSYTANTASAGFSGGSSTTSSTSTTSTVSP
jgi:hypothetical protein